MKQYMSYKSCRIRWIGQIPSEWKVSKVKYLALDNTSIFMDGDWINSDIIESEGIRYLTTGNVGAGEYKEQGDSFISEESFSRLNCLTVLPGDVLISRLNEPIARACIVPDTYDKYVVAVDNVVLRPDIEWNKQYLVYCMNTSRYAEEAKLLAAGTTMQRISRTKLGTLGLPKPPLSTQDKIVSYLNEVIKKIDICIENKLRLSELLQESRTSIICSAITNGINTICQLKDSGTEWLGYIPSHWKVVPAKALFAQSKETRHETDIQLTASQKYGIISQEDYMEKQSYKIVLADKGLENWKHVEPNDFIISLRSFQGGLEISYIPGCITWHYIVLKPKAGVEPEYFKWLFKSPRYIQALQRTANFIRDGQDLRFSNFVQVPLPLIPMDEQKDIAEYLNKETARIDSIIADMTEQIEKLKEYRQSVISEVVTGKVAVE